MALGHTRTAEESRTRQLEMSCRVRFGFDANSLAACFGVRPGKLTQWVRDGLLKPLDGGRFSEVAIARFIREHPQEYDLARVDQTWFKAMVFTGLLRRSEEYTSELQSLRHLVCR